MDRRETELETKTETDRVTDTNRRHRKRGGERAPSCNVSLNGFTYVWFIQHEQVACGAVFLYTALAQPTTSLHANP